MLVPAQLPRVRGDGPRVELALVRLLQERLSTARESPVVTLAARPIGRGDAALDRDLDLRGAGGRRPRAAEVGEPVPALVMEIVRELGGEIRTSADPLMGRTTAIRLDVAAEAGTSPTAASTRDPAPPG